MRLLFNTVLTTATLLLSVAVLVSAREADAHWVTFWAVGWVLISVLLAVQLLHENRVSESS